jgi:hypothetical protein
MAICPKCSTVNEEGLTRCRACNAILPVKLGSKSEVRYERVRRQAELVGIKCPSCGAPNPYTRFRCQQCNASLSDTGKGSGLMKLWVALAIGIAVVVIVLTVLKQV